MSADLRDARIRTFLAGGVALVADADGIDRWQVHGRPANPAEEFVLRGTTVADMEEVNLLVNTPGRRDPSKVEPRQFRRSCSRAFPCPRKGHHHGDNQRTARNPGPWV